MKKEDKKEILKSILKDVRGFVKTTIYFLIVGFIIGRGVLNEEIYNGLMEGLHGFWWKLFGYWCLGFLSVMTSCIIWGLYKFWVTGRNITKDGKLRGGHPA